MSKTTSMLLTALILGLGWAIRGHFGHEWGAAWAGAMGGLAIVAVSRRKDWQDHAPVLALLSGIGWAVGGMMSYGIVIGYCRGVDVGNAYGYAMLAVIGGLYGCIGGGMLGLGLASAPEKRPQWAALITEMVAGAWLFWGFLIYQLEWFMTPPRSELWAACLGAAAAMLWHLHRNGFHNAFRVAMFSALGAGFGFAFGNFIQTLGVASGLSYNWWNVMEFTLGFCGGGGMTYAVWTCSWPEKARLSTGSKTIALMCVFLVIPFVNFTAAFNTEKLGKLAASLSISSPDAFIASQKTWGLVLMFLFTAIALLISFRFRKEAKTGTMHAAAYLLLTLSLYYTLFSFIVKGVFYRAFDPGDSVQTYLPIIFIAGVIGWSRRNERGALRNAEVRESGQTVFMLVAALLFAIVLIALISIHAHDGLNGYHERF